MNEEELAQILRDHKRWVSGEGGKRADLREADLRKFANGFHRVRECGKLKEQK
jgi:hypothetical protein